MSKKHIALMGTHGTGKTTIVNFLREFNEFKDFDFISNTSRKFNEEGAPLNKECTFLGELYFIGQRAKELLCDKHICDRSSYDVLSYSLASKSMSKKEKKIIENIHKQLYQLYDVIFYVPIEFDMEKDGVRPEDEKYRIQIRNIMEDLIVKYPPKRIVHLTGTVENRLKIFMNEVL